MQFCDKFGGRLLWGPCLKGVECLPGEEMPCGFSPEELEEFGWDSDPSEICELNDGVPSWPSWGACDTPLVMVFDDQPIDFTASSATFDISGVGGCVSTDWPSARTPWLALDRDGNGVIEGGGELFGTGTVLRSGVHAYDGFAALQELDSNGDGQLDQRDTRWTDLVLWSDYDEDRRSTLWEQQPLEAFGVESIALNYSTRGECDGRGNCGVERSSFRFRRGDRQSRSGELVDVHLACQ